MSQSYFVLKYAYKMGTLLDNKPIGLSPLQSDLYPKSIINL